MATQALEYERAHGSQTLQPLFESSISHLRHAEVCEWGTDLLREREEMHARAGLGAVSHPWSIPSANCNLRLEISKTNNFKSSYTKKPRFIQRGVQFLGRLLNIPDYHHAFVFERQC